MATDEIRVYSYVFANFAAGSVSDAQWILLFGAAKNYPLSTAVLAAAQGRGAEKYITTHKRSQNAAYLRLYTLLGFEVDRSQVDALLVILNAQAALRSVTGTVMQKFTGVLTSELRDAAISLGYTTTNANKLSVTLINGNGTFSRLLAIEAAQAYLAANAGIWYA